MTLTLTLEGVDRLDNGMPVSLTLDHHGATIGRSPYCDWSLPDPRNHVSGSHCEIDWRDGAYLLIDKSTNGTFLGGSRERLAGAHPVADGDVFTIGPYRIHASLSGAARRSPAPSPARNGGGAWPVDDAPPAPPPPSAAHGGWDDLPSPGPVEAWPSEPPPRPRHDVWDDDPPQPAIMGMGPGSGVWAPPRVVEAGGGWGDEGSDALPGVSPGAREVFDAPRPAPPPADPDDIWSSFTASHEVDWTRDAFDAPPPAPPPPKVEPAAPPPPPATTDPEILKAAAAWTALLEAAGLEPGDLEGETADIAANAGVALRQMVDGLVRMLEARARAKAQMGVEGTIHSTNPLKFVRDPVRVLALMLNPPKRGFLQAERAIDDAFRDLQDHQMATLGAMQGALRSTLDRFSPTAIRGRAETRGLLARIIPAARDAALWQAYEREFDGVARGSDEAFIDVFAKAFRQAYLNQAGKR